jgi:NACHT domain- and WD repeat-containing protein
VCGVDSKFTHYIPTAPLLREIYLSGKLLLRWRHSSMADVARSRYISSNENAKSTHMELANLFFSEFQQEESQKSASDGIERAQETPPAPPVVGAEDVTYSTRHVEEAWLHLLKAGWCAYSIPSLTLSPLCTPSPAHDAG